MTPAKRGLPIPARFGVVGLINTAVGLAIIQLARTWLGLGEIVANAVGYACGLTLSFLLNRGWTFSHTGSVEAAALRFAIVVLLAWVLNMALVLLLIQAGVPPALAHLCGVIPYALGTYLGCRWWVFPRSFPGAETD